MKNFLKSTRDHRWLCGMLLAPTALALSVCYAGVLSAATIDHPADPQARRFPRTNITYREWSAFLTEVRHKPGAIEVDKDNVKRIDIPRETAVYFFTRPAHAAHPAIVRRAVLKHASGTYIHTSGYYAGRRDAFIAWLDTFLDQDETLRKFLDRQRNATPFSRVSSVGARQLSRVHRRPPSAIAIAISARLEVPVSIWCPT